MTKEEYAALLLRPEWKQKRLQILERDNMRCTKCGSKRDLQVHHIRYRGNLSPWEYKDDELVTLCKKCHEKIHGINDSAKRSKKQDLSISKNSVNSDNHCFCKLNISSAIDLFTPENIKLLIILLRICDFAEYNTGCVKLDRIKKLSISKSVGLKYNKVKECIVLLKELGYLKKKKSLWYINPNVAWNGYESYRLKFCDLFNDI